MAIRNIVKEGDEILRKQSREVTAFDQKLWDLLDDMAQTMYKANGVGLAAVQVGVLRQAVVIDVGGGLIELVNPVITKKKGGEIMDVEGKSFNRYGKPITVKGDDLLARALCHEIDHLSGRIFKDLVYRMLTKEEIDKL